MVENTNQGSANNSESIEEDHERDHAVPDVELLAFQKQRSTPKVRLSEVVDGEEVHHLEIDDFAKHGEHKEGEEDKKPHYGMMRAGGEDKVISVLKKAGTLDSDGYPVDASPSTKMKADLAAQNEEEKKE